MKTSLCTRFCALSILIIIVLPARATDESVHPGQFNLTAFIKASVKGLNENTERIDIILENVKKKNIDRICVCEIMELRNNNTKFTNVAIFAEKANEGDMVKSYKMAEKVIAKEKKVMKAIYFDAVKLSGKIAAASDCLSLYLKLKQDSYGLTLYDILYTDSRNKEY